MKNIIFLMAVLITACSEQTNETGEVNMTSTIMQEQGVAIKQYDPVSFFDGMPVKGIATYQHHYKNAAWYFANEKNKQRFEQSPERYVPQYGGYCALAMSLGQVNPGNPETWNIVDDKLYFNSNGFARWLFKVMPGRQAKADSSWRQVM